MEFDTSELDIETNGYGRHMKKGYAKKKKEKKENTHKKVGETDLLT